MGFKIPPRPPDYGAGDDCLHCYDAGKTPNYVFIRFWDVVACVPNPAPPNGYCFICKQWPTNPCMFIGELEFGGATWEASWDAEFGILRLYQLTPFGLFYFRDIEGPCIQDFPANEFSCPIDSAEGGHGHVTVFIDPIIIVLTSGYHFVTIPGVLYDKMECGMDHAIYKLAHRSDKTNILIYLDKQEIEYES